MKDALCLRADLLRAESVTSMAIVCQPGDMQHRAAFDSWKPSEYLVTYNSRSIRYWPSTLVRLKQPLVTPESVDSLVRSEI